MSQPTRSPLWWANEAERLPPGYENNELVREVTNATIAQQVRRGEFDLFNRIEFVHVFAEVIGALRLDSWTCVAEPVLSPNGRMTGIRLYPVMTFNDDGEPEDFNYGVSLVLDNEGRVLADQGFAAYFGLPADHKPLCIGR